MRMNRKKWLAVLAVGAMVITSFNMPFAQTESKAAGYGISNPRVEKGVVISGDDSEKLEGTISNPVVKADVTTWDCITFGNYWQEDTNGDGKVDETDEKQPIKWRVLSVDGDDAFLMADDTLDTQCYNSGEGVEVKDTTWENCSLRKWLNEDFMNTAFSKEEQDSIIETKVQCSYVVDKEDGGNDTLDKIYLPSIEEVSNPSFGFDEEFLRGQGTKTRMLLQNRKTRQTAGAGAWAWWLRTINNDKNVSSFSQAVIVDEHGRPGVIGFYSDFDRLQEVRPVLHLNLSTSNWKKVEEVTVQDISSTWDCVYFGKYNIDESSTMKEPIKWRVLSVDGDDAFLIADQGLDCQRYNESEEEVTWETSTIRQWLNTSFFSEAFSKEEQNSIKNTVVINDNSKGENDTIDKVFLLSKQEVSNLAYGFDPQTEWLSETRKVKITDYAKVKGVSTLELQPFTGFVPWWLRSLGEDNTQQESVNALYGEVSTCKANTRYAVRPAIHISLSSNLWKEAGNICSSAPIWEQSVSDTNDNENGYEVANPIKENSQSKWDCMYFGKYWKEDTNGDGKADQNDDKQPIKWRVLSVTGNEALLLADQVLDYQSYYENDDPVDIPWKESKISGWLNQIFLNNAFSSKEQAAINKTRVVCSLGTRQEEDQSEYIPVYLLSEEEVITSKYQFNDSRIYSDNAKKTGATAYAKEQGASSSKGNDSDIDWLIRTLNVTRIDGELKYNSTGMVSGGEVVSYPGMPLNEKCGIRPALRINLDSNEWTYAGQVYDDGTVVKPEDVVRPTPTVSPMPSATASAAVTTPPQSSETPTSTPTMQPTKSPVLTPTVSPTQSATPSVSTAPTSTPSVATTMTLQPATTPSNTGNQASQLPQQQSTPQAGENTGTTADTNAKVSLIKQSKVSWKTAKNTKDRKLIASWKKASNADGYQIQYAPNKKFKKAKRKTVKSTFVTIKKLKKKKTYFVRVRAYKLADGKKVYGKWSSVKKVKIKK